MDKPAYKSKLNWVGAVLVLGGLLSDPMIKEFIPPEIASKVMWISGALVLILRTFFTTSGPIEETVKQGELKISTEHPDISA